MHLPKVFLTSNSRDSVGVGTMTAERKFILSILLTLMMVSVPWASADTSQWIGPNKITSNGQTVTVDGWNVPGNATVLNSWMTVDEEMIYANNGSEWRVDTTNNFTVGQFSSSTMDHFGGRLSLEPDQAVSQIETFSGTAQMTFNNWPEFGNTSIWEPGLPGSVTNGTRVGQTRQMSYGDIPASANSGSVVAATIMDGAVPAGQIAAIRSPSITIPSPINHFNLSLDNWRHTGPNDAVWVEYKLDSGPWSWLEPVGGYNSNVTLSTSAAPSATPNNSTTFPAWSNPNSTGWTNDLFLLDNLTGINNSVALKIRFRISTDVNSPGRPGWFIDDVSLTNVGGATGYWHHGCYVVTGTCQYSNNAVGVLQGQVDLTNAGTNSEIRIQMEWDLEGSLYDNFCIELSPNNQTWTDISSSTSATTTACRSRSGAIPGSGYTINGVNYGDETNGFVTLALGIPTSFQNSGLTDIAVRVETDSSVQYGGTTDGQEGLTLDRISVVSSTGTVLDDDTLSNSNTMWTAIAGDWNYISIGAGALALSYGYEDSQAGAPNGPPTGWSSTGDWDFGPLQGQPTEGPTSWTSAPFGWGTNLQSGYSGSNWDHLFSPSYAIPAGASARLTFSHWMCSESGYDGGAVFISTDNQTWTHFDPGNNWYDTTGLSFNTGANLASVGIFNGANVVGTGFNCQGPHNFWSTKEADLTTYSGQTVWFRFSFESDSIISYDGWYVDDVGLEVDYFLDEGGWISDVLALDDIGLGFIDIDGTIPIDTWATGSVLDVSGNVIAGFDNVSFPISLHGLDRASHANGIRIQINMGTDDPFLTPLIDAVHVGSVRTFDARGPGNGWNVNSNLDLWESNLTNNGSAVLQINSPFIHSSRPVTAVDFAGVGSQITLRAVDSNGNVIGTSGLTGTIQFPDPQPGFGVRIEVNPNGHISSLWAEGDMAQPAINPEADVTGDGTVDWEFPIGPSYGAHGWQQFIHEAADGTVSTSQNQQLTSDLDMFANQVETVSVLIPGDAIVTSGAISIYCDPCIAPVNLSIGSSSITSFGSGLNTASLSPTQIAHINMIPPQSGLQNNRDWRIVELNMSSNLPTTIAQVGEVRSITLGYSISENLTTLTQQVIDYHAAAVLAGSPTSVDIPIAYTADKGAVVIGGGVYHELMITNYPFSAPGTMYPNGDVTEITTRHRHLYDNTEISKISLTGYASDGTSIIFEVADPAGSPTFSQISGSSQLPMEMDCSIVENGGILEVDWRFHVSWQWDDVANIAWSALAHNQTGVGIAPATAQTGGPGSQAIENDLEISGLTVYNQAGYDISNQFSPEYPFHVQSGEEVHVSGNVRFQNTPNLRPLQDDFAMIINNSGVETPLSTDGLGTFSGNVTLTSNSLSLLSPKIGRVGPITGSTGANDTTISPPAIEILTDNEAPVAGPILVSTSTGLLDANGYVWDPVSPLSVYITVSDAQDRSSEVTLNYWREGIDDLNADGTPQPDEYQTYPESLYTLRSGSQQVTFSNIPVGGNGFNGKVSMWISGTDWAGNSYQDGNTGGGPGFADDWATLQTAENTETVLLNTGFGLDSIDEHLLAGQVHTVSMTIQDANGVQTLDDVGVYLAGQVNAPLGEIHYDPRQDILTTVAGSFVTPLSAVVTPLSADTSKVDITFSVSWDMPSTQSHQVPGFTITDDMQIVTNVNNLNAIRWKLDNELTAVITNLEDLTPPVTTGSTTQIHVQEGDEVEVEGMIVYSTTNIPLEIPSENLSVLTQILFGSTTIERTVTVQEGGTFNSILVLPTRTPLTPEMPIQVVVLNLPGLATSDPNMDSTIVVDSEPPEVVFDPYRFPSSSLMYLESDRLDAVTIDLVIVDQGGFPTTPLEIEWAYLRVNGLPRMGMGGNSSLTFVDELDGQYHFTGIFDMNPAGDEKLNDGDYISIWASGIDLSGNDLTGEGTASTPRVPSFSLIEFEPELTGWDLNPDIPEYGGIIEINAIFRNNGMRSGSINVQLVEDIDGAMRTVDDNVTVNFTAKQSNRVATFEWEAWKSGEAKLFIIVDGDEFNSIAVEKIIIAEPESESLSDNAALLGIIAFAIGAAAILLLVIVMRRPSESMDDYDESDDIWYDDDGNEIDDLNGIRLDFEDETLSNTAARYSIHDKTAFLKHAQTYDRDRDGFLDASELEQAAKDFIEMLAKPMVSMESTYPLDFNNETVSHIIGKHHIFDKDAFLAHASGYDSDENGYLKQSELERAAEEYVASGLNQELSPSAPADPRELAIAEVVAALPDWSHKRASNWMDKGWSAEQIIAHHSPSETEAPPAAPVGFGSDYVAESPVVEEPVIEPEPEITEVEIIDSVATELPSEAALKRMKKAELVSLAEERNLGTSGTKADIIARLLG